jgi:hypothetical protein
MTDAAARFHRGGLGGAAAWPFAARAQQQALPVIGFLSTQSAEVDYKDVTIPFLQGLKEAGYVEGQNVAVEYRYAENQIDRLPALVADGVAGEVRAGPVEAGDKTQCDRVTACGKDDRYGGGRCLRRQRCGGAGGYDHGYAAADEIGCERRQHSAETSTCMGLICCGVLPKYWCQSCSHIFPVSREF